MRPRAQHSHRRRARSRPSVSLPAGLALLTVSCVCLGALLISPPWHRIITADTGKGEARPGLGVGPQAGHTSGSARQCAARLMGSGLLSSEGTEARWVIYDALGRDMLDHGLVIEGTQGVSVKGMFEVQNGLLRPNLQHLDIPVRAIIFRYIETQVQHALQSSVERHILPLVSKTGIWLQDPNLYHSTVFHASPHQFPVPGTEEEIKEEVQAARDAAGELCPLTVRLARVVAISKGVVMAAWQVKSGEDPMTIRSALHQALPQSPAPAKQTVRQPEILHTTLARLTETPTVGDAADPQHALQMAVERMTEELCGLSATIQSLWYVQEQDLLALALGGRYTDVELPMTCHGQQQLTTLAAVANNR